MITTDRLYDPDNRDGWGFVAYQYNVKLAEAMVRRYSHQQHQDGAGGNQTSVNVVKGNSTKLVQQHHCHILHGSPDQDKEWLASRW